MSLTHQTAQKLKNAGFPQELQERRCGHSEPWGMCCEIPLYIPTLEELIIACGSVLLYVNEDDCRAESIEPVNNDHSDWNNLWKKPFKGSTPSEAVANLWLELNKK